MRDHFRAGKWRSAPILHPDSTNLFPTGKITATSRQSRGIFVFALADTMSKLRILIVDDEPLARARVRSLLQKHSSVQICGECGDGVQALEAIERDHPDIVFLDVKMPGCDGLELLGKIPDEGRPAIVLVTAYSEFAVDGFAKHVVDFLLKPFDAERLGVALERASAHVRMTRSNDLSARIEGALADSAKRTNERLVFKAGGSRIFLKASDIVWVEAANNYSTLHLADTKRLIIRQKISAVERQLTPCGFVRISRSALVHIDQLQELQPTKSGDFHVILRNGARLPLSRYLRGRFTEIVTSNIRGDLESWNSA
jgi:two-component system, LytTR family, response regulator